MKLSDAEDRWSTIKEMLGPTLRAYPRFEPLFEALYMIGWVDGNQTGVVEGMHAMKQIGEES